MEAGGKEEKRKKMKGGMEEEEEEERREKDGGHEDAGERSEVSNGCEYIAVINFAKSQRRRE